VARESFINHFSHHKNGLSADNSNIPDTDFMWREYRGKPTQVACRLVKGEVCAKFSYTFNGASEYETALNQLCGRCFAFETKFYPRRSIMDSVLFLSSPLSVENITYLCTKVNIENETAVNQGCFKQMKSGHEIEVCVCESWAGGTPCNGTARDNLSHVIFIALSLALWVKCLGT
jgi:hypothetical protein